MNNDNDEKIENDENFVDDDEDYANLIKQS